MNDNNSTLLEHKPDTRTRASHQLPTERGEGDAQLASRFGDSQRLERVPAETGSEASAVRGTILCDPVSADVSCPRGPHRSREERSMTDESSRDTRFATALHGDVAGYSKLTADNEIETHNTRQAFRRIIEEGVRTNNGARSRPPDAARIGRSLAESQPPIAQQGQPRPVHRRTRGCRTGVSPGDPGQSRLPV